LNPGLAGPQEAVLRIDANAEVGAFLMSFDDILDDREQVGDEPLVSGRSVIGIDRQNVPEGGVNRVVSGNLTGLVGEIIGKPSAT
jgi:hypothetical protein